MEIGHLSEQELDLLKHKIDREKENRKIENLAKAAEDFIALCVKYGVTPSAVIEHAHKKARKPVAIKYHDGNGNTWTGRGRAPRWLVQYKERGGDINQLAV